MAKAFCRELKKIVRQDEICPRYKGSGLRGECSQCRHAIYFYRTADGQLHLAR